MLTNFQIFHKSNPSGNEAAPNASVDLVHFKTCLRSLYFGWLSEGEEALAPGFEVYKGRYAYQFILEVICGLHSPVIGETEVFGQFKNFLQTTPISAPLFKVFEALMADAKKIRKEHLTDLGGQSYGSLLRKMISHPTPVEVIGAGAFMQQLLPWIYKDENEITAYARDIDKARQMLPQDKFPRLHLKPLAGAKLVAPFVLVAAPLSSQEIHSLVGNEDALVIDLRGESHQDPCQFKKYVHLNSFFEQIQKNQIQLNKVKAVAVKAIEVMGRERDLMENFRPFGWDDLCAW